MPNVKKSAVKKPDRVIRLSRAEQKIKRTNSMLDAAWALFCKKGYDFTTLEEVAEYVGVSRYPVYYAFRDKQNLFFELWKREVDSGISTINSKIKMGASLHDNLEAMAQWTVDEYAKNPHTADGLFFVIQSIGLSRPDIAEKIDAVTTSVVDSVASAIKSSVIPTRLQLRAPAWAVATHVVAIVNGLGNMRSKSRKIPLNTPDLLETFLTIATRKK